MTFSLETSFAFPLIKLMTRVTFSKVKKPSGISYFLLVLINEWQEKSMTFGDLLPRFGVPFDMFDMFGNELVDLVRVEILNSSITPIREYFAGYRIDEFTFTSKGRKVFEEELIPLDRDETLLQELFYDPVSKQLSINRIAKFGSIVNTALSEEFCSQFEIPTSENIEDYLNTKKGNGIDIKREEVIVQIELVSTDYLFTTSDLLIELTDHDQIKFSSTTKELSNFFNTFYLATQIQKGLLLKNKFKFPDFTIQSTTSLSEEAAITNIRFPEEWNKLIKSQGLITLSTNNQTASNSKQHYSEVDFLLKLHPAARFLNITSDTTAVVYIPINVKFDYHDHWDLIIPLILERKLTLLEHDQIISQMINLHTSLWNDQKYSFEHLVQLCKNLKQFSKVKPIITSFLKVPTEEAISRIAIMKDILSSEPLLYDYLKAESLTIATDYVSQSTIESLSSRVETVKWIFTGNKISDSMLLKKILELPTFMAQHDNLKLFDALENSAFEWEDLLMVLPNSLALMMSGSQSTSKLAAKITRLSYTLQKMKDNSGIHDPIKYEIKSSVDKQQFHANFTQLSESFKELYPIVKKFPSEFGLIKELLSIYGEIDQLFKIEEDISKNPQSITKSQVISELNAHNILLLTVTLYIKLTWICKTKKKYGGDMSQMIDRLVSDSEVNNDEAKLLHAFRKYRNDIEHVNDKQQDFTISDFEKVINIIFKLEDIRK